MGGADGVHGIDGCVRSTRRLERGRGHAARSATATAEVLVEAEEMLLAAARAGTSACLLRLSGLYGPGRDGILDRVRTGRLALGPGDDAWMSFCHRDDAVAFVAAAIENGETGAVYHGTDAEPALRRDVVS